MLKVVYDTKHEYYKVAGNEYYLYIGKRVNSLPPRNDDDDKYYLRPCEFEISKKVIQTWETLQKNIYKLLYEDYRYRFIESRKYKDVPLMERCIELGKSLSKSFTGNPECRCAGIIGDDIYYDYLRHGLAPPKIFWVEDWYGDTYMRKSFGINAIEHFKDWI